ncbi:MAG: hypothetical protein M3O71_01760 [Bacteroidota bacterium]|nr:hypothetical protein [Bacteroidota bacterium]
MKDKQPSNKIRQIVKKSYADSPFKELTFRTFGRCRKPLKAAFVIAEPLNSDTDEQFIISAASWLHDFYYTEAPMNQEIAVQRICGQNKSHVQKQFLISFQKNYK